MLKNFILTFSALVSYDILNQFDFIFALFNFIKTHKSKLLCIVKVKLQYNNLLAGNGE